MGCENPPLNLYNLGLTSTTDVNEHKYQVLCIVVHNEIHKMFVHRDVFIRDTINSSALSLQNYEHNSFKSAPLHRGYGL